MRLILVEKDALTPEQESYLQQRLQSNAHREDKGPPAVWNVYSNGLFAFVHIDLGLPVAIVEASGIDNVAPGWWIDSEFRGNGYGNELVDILAEYLKDKGVRHAGRIPIQTHNGEYDQQSSKLAQRFRSHFGVVTD